MKQDPPIFIRVIDGRLILWDYRSHSQYEIEEEHVRRILAISRNQETSESQIDSDIIRSGIFDDDSRDFKKWGWDCLSHIFHLGTQIVLEEGADLPNDDSYEGYIKYCTSIIDKIPETKYAREGELLSLPAPNKKYRKGTGLYDVLMARQTSRSFNSSPIPLQTVANSLYWTFGAVHGDMRQDMLDAGLVPVGYRRTSPSGGSLQPSEAYLVALNIEGLTAGIYHYRAFSHELTLITTKIDGEKLGKLLCAQMFAKDLAYGIFVTSRFDKMWWKYPHSRAYRVALLDIGCLAQTFQLVTTELGLGSWLTGYFLDREVNKLLEVDEMRESVLFFLGAGMGDGTPFAPQALQTIERMLEEQRQNQREG